MKKDISIPLKNSNLYLVASGLDRNGNKVIKLKFPNERGFSIQTNGALPKTNNILRGLKTPKDMFEISNIDLITIENECINYIISFGSTTQKKKIKTYSK